METGLITRSSGNINLGIETPPSVPGSGVTPWAYGASVLPSVILAGVRQAADTFALVAALFGFLGALIAVVVARWAWRAFLRPVSLLELIIGALAWRHWRRRRNVSPMPETLPYSGPYPPPWYQSPSSSPPPPLPPPRYGRPSAALRLGPPLLPSAPVAGAQTPPDTHRHVGRSVALGPRHRGR